MESYKMTAVDVEPGLGDVYKSTVESGKPSRKWIWNLIGVVFLIALCCVACLLGWHFISHNQRELTAAQQSTPTAEHHRQILAKITNSTKAAIHLHVSGRSDRNKPLQWVNNVDQSFSVGGLKLKDNEIVIPSDGLYFVYSQASFDVPCLLDEDEADDIHMPLSYSIQWSSTSTGSTRHLLNGVKSACQPSAEEEQENEEHVYEVIYLGAVFRLYKGDRLATSANHLEHIEKLSSKTFFGVFEL